MPIVFAQPEPFAPGINAGMGALEQYHQNRQYQLQQQAQQLHAQRLLAQQQQQAAEFQQHQMEYAQQPVRQAQSLAIQGQAQVQLMHDEFTMGDQLELQRIQSGKAYVDRRVHDGELTAEEAKPWYEAVAPTIDMLKKRQILDQQKKEEEQTKRVQQQVKDQGLHEETMAKLRAKTVSERTTWIDNDPTKGTYDPTQEAHAIITHTDGKETHIVKKPSKPEKDQDAIDIRKASQQAMHDAAVEVQKEYTEARHLEAKDKEYKMPMYLATPDQRYRDVLRRHAEWLRVFQPQALTGTTGSVTPAPAAQPGTPPGPPAPSGPPAPTAPPLGVPSNIVERANQIRQQRGLAPGA